MTTKGRYNHFDGSAGVWRWRDAWRGARGFGGCDFGGCFCWYWRCCWWLTFVMAADFYGGGLRLVSFGGIFLMWAVMMAAMMTPSFLPALLLFAKWQKNGNQQSPQQSAKNRTAVLQNTKPNNAAVWQNLAAQVLACGYLVVCSVGGGRVSTNGDQTAIAA